MLAITKTAALSGIYGTAVDAEVTTERGLPAYHVIGLGDTAVKESAERVRGAILSSGFDYPKGRTTVNLSPAWIRKSGSHYDLAIAAAILAAEGTIPTAILDGKAFLGELNLSGAVRGVRGVLPMVVGLRGQVDEIYVAEENSVEACMATKESKTSVIAVKSLRHLIAMLRGEERKLFIYPENSDFAEKYRKENKLDFADVKGQFAAKEAITAAVAGGHGILLIGSPGTGKTMLAKRIPTVLPEMTAQEALETSMIYSAAGKLNQSMPMVQQRPFRELNRTATPAGILGGGIDPQPGEASLAHNGILFIDEFLEMGRQKTELLRQPIEEGKIRLIRRGQEFEFPASFTLAAATNPCPCGYLGDEAHPCTCTQTQIDNYRMRLSGPMCERIDMCVEIRRVDYNCLQADAGTSSAQMREKVMQARARQKERLRGSGVSCNARMNEAMIEEFCRPDAEGEKFLELAYRRFHLSPRRYHKILKLARTIADLQDMKEIRQPHLAGALQYTRFFDES